MYSEYVMASVGSARSARESAQRSVGPFCRNASLQVRSRYPFEPPTAACRIQTTPNDDAASQVSRGTHRGNDPSDQRQANERTGIEVFSRWFVCHSRCRLAERENPSPATNRMGCGCAQTVWSGYGRLAGHARLPRSACADRRSCAPASTRRLRVGAGRPATGHGRARGCVPVRGCRPTQAMIRWSG